MTASCKKNVEEVKEKIQRLHVPTIRDFIQRLKYTSEYIRNKNTISTILLNTVQSLEYSNFNIYHTLHCGHLAKI